jgi:hypothetical protein
MEKKELELLRKLISAIEGAPYPDEGINGELYAIWYEHTQQIAQEALEFYNECCMDTEEKVAPDLSSL